MKVYAALHYFDIMSTCVKNDLYTRGTNNEYEDMLNTNGVGAALPVADLMELIAKLAKDIADHSEGREWQDVACILASKAIYMFE